MDALLLVDKPSGYTSQAVISAIKRTVSVQSKIERIGHAGTLDPLGTGLLVVLLNGATSLQELFLRGDKEYAGEFQLGVTTDSDDIEGKILQQCDREELRSFWQKIDEPRVTEIVKRFTGRLLQHPPRISAVHIDGQRSYMLARAGSGSGQVVAAQDPSSPLPAAREVMVDELELSLPRFDNDGSLCIGYRMRVSKGTYVRSIARDIGQEIGSGAVVKSLRRIRSGVFSVVDAAACEIVRDERNRLSAKLEFGGGSLLPVEQAVQGLPEVELDGVACARVLRGERQPLASVFTELQRHQAGFAEGAWGCVFARQPAVGGDRSPENGRALSFIVERTRPEEFSDGIPLKLRYRRSAEGRIPAS